MEDRVSLSSRTEDIILSDYNLSDLSDAILRAFIKDISSLKKEDVYHMKNKCDKSLLFYKTENSLLEKQIKILRPKFLPKVQKNLEFSEAIGEQIYKFKKASLIFSDKNEISEFMSSLTRRSIESLTPSFYDTISIATGPKLSAVSSSSLFSEKLTYKFLTAIIVREIDELLRSINNFISSFQIKKLKLLNEIEERKIAISYVKSTKRSLNKRFFGKEIVLDLNEYGSKFFEENGKVIIHGFNETIKNASNNERRMKMQITVLNKKLKKIMFQIKYMEEIGGKVKKVDFDELNIFNKELKKDLVDKTENCVQFKLATGLANELSFSRKIQLDNLEEKLKGMKIELKNKYNLIGKLNDERDILRKEISYAEMENKKIKHLLATKKAPKVMDYMILKSRTRESDKKLKVMIKRTEEQKKNIAFLRGKLKRVISLNQDIPVSLKRPLLSGIPVSDGGRISLF